ncbi:hypothetical protein ACXYTJ_00135 [Gilvimarinus sp. F26214L]|uniref:hypothetical protein n=1 Tax=Gilvimarinus sp. DZF01 TaxID=3461371 RepID=UPI0040457DAB
MNKHTIMMLVGCLLPLLLIFVLPLLGVDSGVVLWIFIILMFGCHLLMMGGHGKGGHGTDGHHKDKESS